MEGYDRTTSSKPIKIIGPSLHHPAPRFKEVAVVVSSPYQIVLCVRELTLDRIGRPTLRV